MAAHARRKPQPEGNVRFKEVRTALLAVVAILTLYVGIRAYIRRIRETAEPQAET
jgi:hypothetical protein